MSIAMTAAPGRTLGAIARDEGVALHKLLYVVTSRGIKPAYRIGRLRIYTDDQVVEMKRHMGEMNVRRPIAD